MDVAIEARDRPAAASARHALLKEFRTLLEAVPEDAAQREDDAGMADGPASPALEAHVLVADALRARATDIHLDALPDGYRIRLRVDGRIVDAMQIDLGRGRQLVNQFKVLAGADPLPSYFDVEGAYRLALDDGAEIFVRVAAVHCMSGDKVAVRLLSAPETFDDIPELGIRGAGVERIRNWISSTAGLLLVAGPTGAGKTTTLYTLLHKLKFGDCQVMTIEDPVEYLVPGINQIEVDKGRGMSFGAVTSSLLRLDPDYVLIGEIRDSDSAQAAITVASSGRALMATLHSRDAAGTISSLRNLGVENHDIAANLGLVIAQRLVRRLCDRCRESTEPDASDIERLQALGCSVPDRDWKAVGCSACNGLGYRGRTGLFEIWQPGPDDLRRILQHGDEHSLRRAMIDSGQALMLDDGLAKVEEGQTTLHELFRVGVLLGR